MKHLKVWKSGRRIVCGIFCGILSLSLLGPGTFRAAGEAVFDDYPVLKDLYADYFKMGIACEAISHWNNRLAEIGNPQKEALMLKEFNSMTFGNELKPAYNMAYKSPEATETDLPFGHNRAAIQMLDWAKANGMSVRGHTLIWHSQCEDAVFCKGYQPVYQKNYKLDPDCLVDAETMKLRMESYIHHVMEYIYANGYGDVIYAWDVVNEAIEPGANGYNLRESYWYQIIGPEYLYDAFKYTREAVEQYSAEYASLYGVDPSDPEALKAIQPKLFYNDYNEFQASKRDAIIQAVKPIVADGYLDGIGMQGHLSDTTNIEQYITALNMFSETVDEVHITELDVTRSSSGLNAEYYQGMFYYRLFSALIEARKAGAKLTCVTIWGLTDDNSWKKENYPLIFNGDLTAKTAFTGLVCAVTGEKMPEPAYEEPDFSDGIFSFDQRAVDPAALGFTVRGDGSLTVQTDVKYSGRGALRNSGRTASWNGVSFDVSRFMGQTIRIHAWVLSDDSQVKLTADIDGTWPNITTVRSGGQWAEVNGTYTVPADLPGLKLYFETNGLADIYVDDLQIQLVGMDEGFEGDSHIALPRGVGHVPQLTVVTKERRTGSKSLKVTREAQEATVQFDLSKYVGRTVEVSAFVKTADAWIQMGLEGAKEPLAQAAAEGWTELRAAVTIPADGSRTQLYIETSGTADFFVDDFTLRLGTERYDLEDGVLPFTTRWQGAGELSIVEEESGNHAARLTAREASYYGISFDVSAYLGMKVEITFDVKTEDRTVKLTGDIDNSWPNYLTARTEPGSYKTVQCVVQLPGELTALRVYVETDGTADLFVDNFSIAKAQ